MKRDSEGTSRPHLQALFSLGMTATLTDGQLLERFATLGGKAAESAFDAIVERHAPMVFHTCRGILEDEHEALDAFQATFLVLLRKGDTLWVQDSLGPWLHRVASRAAARARSDAQRRRDLARRALEVGETLGEPEGRGELAAALHEEVDRLPEHYRVPVVLCDLEGRSYAEAAQRLRCPVGTVRSRLARAREQLRLRLTRRGLAPAASASASILGALLIPTPASAAVPPGWTRSIREWARSVLAGEVPTAGEVPASVLVIAEGVLTMISTGKRTLLTATILAALGLSVGVGVLAQPSSEPTAPAKETAKAARAERRWSATLPGGGTIEVLGASSYPTGQDTWWSPDGSPLAEPLCDSPPKNLGMDNDYVYRVIAVRVSGLPVDANVDWAVKEAGGFLEGAAKKDGKALPGIHAALIGVPKALATGSVEFSAATGPWKTVGTNDGRRPAATASKFGPSFIFGVAVEDKKGTTITVSHDVQDKAVRIVAVDPNGHEFSHDALSGSGVKDFSQIAARFSRLGFDIIREYRLQTRDYERATIADVALRPTEAR